LQTSGAFTNKGLAQDSMEQEPLFMPIYHQVILQPSIRSNEFIRKVQIERIDINLSLKALRFRLQVTQVY
jgi:hypothetical protein